GLTYEGKTRPVQTYFVTGNFFSLLGLKPALGRFFEPREGEMAGADPVTVLSWEYWHSQFQDDPAIIGKTVAINGRSLTIVGVGPKGFVGPTPLLHIQAFLLLGMLVIDAGTPPDFLSKVDARPLIVLARLKHGSGPEQVSPALNVVGEHLLASYPRPDEKHDGDAERNQRTVSISLGRHSYRIPGKLRAVFLYAVGNRPLFPHRRCAL
ncbi:MAG TPA: ABC transporter permease, partial [Candidatus Angelobacter sp.]|nr:ABC transporter permease [Candidatus Angelobacter sp.]